MDTPLLTVIMRDLKVDLGSTVYVLQPVAVQLLAWFFMFELSSGLLLANPGTNPLMVFKSKFTTWAFLYLIIYYFKKLMDLIETLFLYFAKVATRGGSDSLPLEEIPYNVINVAFKLIKELFSYIVWNKPATWILLIGIIVGLYIFAKVALTVGMVVLEYLVMSSLVIVLVPFMMFEKLRFVGDKVVGTLINLNMKIFVIQYLIVFFAKFLTKPIDIPAGAGGTEIIETSFYWLVAMAILALMTLKGHEMAQTLISGVTSFGDSSELIAMARKGIGSMGKRMGNMITGGKVSVGAGKGAIAGAREGAVKGVQTGGSIGGAVGAALGGMKGALQGGSKSYRNSKK